MVKLSNPDLFLSLLKKVINVSYLDLKSAMVEMQLINSDIYFQIQIDYRHNDKILIKSTLVYSSLLLSLGYKYALIWLLKYSVFVKTFRFILVNSSFTSLFWFSVEVAKSTT